MAKFKSDFLNVLDERGFVHQCSDFPGLDALAGKGGLTDSQEWSGQNTYRTQVKVQAGYTSGGLLVSCDPASVDAVLALFAREGFEAAAVIGSMQAGPSRVDVQA